MAERNQEPAFNTVAEVYDSIKLAGESAERLAERLVEKAKLAAGQRVLDVACGTGWATMVAAGVVGETGWVTGIDIADKMLDLANEKAVSTGLSNVEYLVGDGGALEFNDASFDAVICALSIFLFRDIPKALSEWHRVMKAEGTIAFSSFGGSFLQPVIKLLNDRLTQYEGKPSPPRRPSMTDTQDKCRELLNRAGFNEIEVTTEQLGLYLTDIEEYWQQISKLVNFRARLARLRPTEFERFKAEHLLEVESLRTDRGIWIDVPVHFSVARNPAQESEPRGHRNKISK